MILLNHVIGDRKASSAYLMSGMVLDLTCKVVDLESYLAIELRHPLTALDIDAQRRFGIEQLSTTW